MIGKRRLLVLVRISFQEDILIYFLRKMLEHLMQGILTLGTRWDVSEPGDVKVIPIDHSSPIAQKENTNMFE